MTTLRHNLTATLGSVLLSFSVLFAGPNVRAEEACEGTLPKESARAEIAVSLKRLEAELASCQPAGICARQSLTLHGMTRVNGYVIDAENHDIELFGGTDSAAAPLRVDDFVVALRNALHKYVEHKGDVLLYSDPGVTIDPDPVVLHKLDRIMANGGGAGRDRLLQAWCSTCELPQTVRVFGLGEDSSSHFSQVMFSGDFLMKRISNGTAPVGGLDSLSDLALKTAIERAKQDPDASAEPAELNRFWFTPGATEYREDDGAVVLDRADVVLRTEAEEVSNGRVAASGGADPLAESFACAFSRLYPDLTAADTHYPVYVELEALFRWVALAKIMVGGDAFDASGYNPKFLIDGFVVPASAVPRSVKGVAHVAKWDHVQTDGDTRTLTSLRLPSCGGVAISMRREDMTPLPDAEGLLPQLSTAVTASRPAQPIPWWVVRM